MSRVAAFNLAPCGTPAAYRRHCRRGEPADEACKRAARADRARRGYGTDGGALSPDTRERRNGLPEFRPYTYQGTGRDLFDGTDLFEEAS